MRRILIILTILSVNSVYPVSIHTAIQNGDSQKVRQILKSNPDAYREQNTYGYPPLHYAAYTQSVGCAQVLLSYGAHVNQVAAVVPPEQISLSQKKDVTREKMTPLQLAIQSNGTKIVKVLLDAGADINWGPPESFPPLTIAVINENVKIVELLLNRGADPNQHARRTTALHKAIGPSKVDEQITRLLLKQGANPNIQDATGKTPLHLAVEMNPEITKSLLDAGAKPNKRDKRGRTALHAVADVRGGEKQARLTASARLLIEEHAQIDAKANGDVTPLFLAAQTGNEPIVNILLRHDANPNAQDSKGRTPLYIATHNGHRKIVKSLLKKGAHPDIATEDDMTALDVAKEQGYRAIERVLRTVKPTRKKKKA